MHLGTETLEGQIAVSSRHRCNACQVEFTVTPAQPGDIRCHLKGCRSYKLDEDIDAAAARGPVELKGLSNGRKVRIKQTPLDPDREACLQQRHGVMMVVRPVRLPS